MGRIRNGSDVGRTKNVQHLEELCKLLSDPNASVKQLNTLYAIRTAWASRGYLLDRELLIVRTDSSGEYISKAAQRASRGGRQPEPSQSNEVGFSDTEIVAAIGNHGSEEGGLLETSGNTGEGVTPEFIRAQLNKRRAK